MTPAAPSPVGDLLSRCRDVLAREPAGLLCDIDGTLSEIAPTPDAAVVSPAMRASLRRLLGQLALVAAVSGRTTASASRMVGIPDLLYIGNHGMERLEGGVWSPHPLAAGAEERVAAALAEVEAALAGHAGGWLLVEHKGLTGTVHYRLAPDHAAARALVQPAVAAAAARHGLKVTEGRAILELRPPVRVDKGTAVAGLIRERGLRGAIFLGDDVTDIDAFDALRAARERDGVATLSIAVLGPETPERVAAAADAAVDGVPGVAMLLSMLAGG
ncbi:MAG: trehalose-phosphatase [Chloroflexota bacterium]